MSLQTLKDQKGFTIVELLIVIVVIGILAAITIVAFNGIQDRARNTTAKEAATNISKKLQVAQTLGIALPADITSQATKDAFIDALDDQPETTLDSQAEGTIAITAAPTQNAPVAWNLCTGGGRITYWQSGTNGTIDIGNPTSC